MIPISVHLRRRDDVGFSNSRVATEPVPSCPEQIFEFKIAHIGLLGERIAYRRRLQHSLRVEEDSIEGKRVNVSSVD